MPNLFYLPTLLLYVISFSGLSKPAIPAAKVVPVVIKNHSVKEGHDLIPWTPERRLTWNDFLSEPLRNTDAVASTSTSLGLSYQIINSQLTYQITCDFSKTKSWMLMKTPYILAHEQGHFDITEIFARKLYQALQHYPLRIRSYKNDINAIYEDIVQQKEAFQETYDNETNHSRNKKLQYQWFDTIGQMLQETALYANYP